MIRISLIALVIFAATVKSCVLETEPYKPGTTGKGGYVAVLMPKQMHEGPLAQMVKDSMQHFLVWLPQYEQRFDVNIFDAQKIQRGAELSRNIITFKVTDEEDAGVEVAEESPFAKGQLYIVVRGKSESELVELFKTECGNIMEIINRKEYSRYKSELEQDVSGPIKNELKSLMGVSITLPGNNSKLKEKSRDFVWVKRDHKAGKNGNTYYIQEGIFIYHQPYEDTTQFAVKNLMRYRDEVLKKNVPGPATSIPTYMRTTPDSLFKPYARTINYQGKYAVEVRGQWGVTDSLGNYYPLGGPFISLSVYDEKYKRIVTAEGYINAPEFSVREYIRRLEVYLKTLEVGL